MIRIKELEKLNEIIEIVISSSNDWPTSVDNLLEFENEIKNFINSETTMNNISSALANVDFSTESWQAESLSQLIKIFNYFDKGKSLKDIFEQLSKRIML